MSLDERAKLCFISARGDELEHELEKREAKGNPSKKSLLTTELIKTEPAAIGKVQQTLATRKSSLKRLKSSGGLLLAPFLFVEKKSQC